MTTLTTCPPAAEPVPILEGAAADEVLARLAKALGHPARVAIVRFLSHQESCCHGDLADLLPLAKSTVSEHLKVLERVGLVRGEIDGPRSCYCIEPAGLKSLKLLVEGLCP